MDDDKALKLLDHISRELKLLRGRLEVWQELSLAHNDWKQRQDQPAGALGIPLSREDFALVQDMGEDCVRHVFNHNTKDST